jgi:hypothetical protein
MTATNPHRSCRPQTSALLLALALMPLPLVGAGCNVVGLAANAMPEADVPARYTDLRGHSVAVLAWAPRGLETDYPTLRLDLVSATQSRLQKAQKAGRGELKNTTFPHAPASLVRFQEDHPELERSPITSVAPRLGVRRLIYIELENFQTRSDQSVELYRGSATISLRVVEVADGQAKVAYEETGLTTFYPPRGPDEGMPGVGDARIYRGTVDILAASVAHRFYAHPSGK